MTTPQTPWGQRHPTLRNLVYGAGAIVAVYAAVQLFGPETVKAWITDILAFFGVGAAP